MARDGEIHGMFAGLLERRQTPWVAAILSLVTAIVLLPIGSVKILAEMSSFAALVAFFAVNLALIALRYKQPHHPRPFRVPGAIGRMPVLPLAGDRLDRRSAGALRLADLRRRRRRAGAHRAGVPGAPMGAASEFGLGPELLAGDPRALGHRRELGPHHVGIDRGLADPGAVAAIAAGDHVLAADEFGVAADALRDQLRMLDEVRLRIRSRRESAPCRSGSFTRLEHGAFVGVARVGGFERDRVRPRREHDVDDVGERHVVVVRALVVAPAQMHAKLLGRDVAGGVIERLDVHADALAELLEVEVGVLDVPAHAEIGAVDLQHEAGTARRSRIRRASRRRWRTDRSRGPCSGRCGRTATPRRARRRS